MSEGFWSTVGVLAPWVFAILAIVVYPVYHRWMNRHKEKTDDDF